MVRRADERKRILVVDDDANFAGFVHEALAQAGVYEVRVAADSFQAGFMANEFRPDLVLLDIRLADADGRKVCRTLRNLSELRGTRAIAMSGWITDDDIPWLPRDGFDDYLRKPFSISTLLEKVAKVPARPSVWRVAKG